LFPLLFYCFSGNLFRRIVLSGLAGSLLALAVLLFSRYLAPPINNSIFSTLGGSALQGFNVLTGQFLLQLKSLFGSGKMTSGLGATLIVLFLLGDSLPEIISRIRQNKSFETLLHSQTFFDFYNMAVLLIAGMSLYLADGFYRVFFPPLLVSLLMQIAQKRYRFIKFWVILSILFAPAVFNSRWGLDSIKVNYTHRMPGVSDSQKALNELAPFDPTASNPWCNTILIPLKFYDGRLTALDPGIGISYILSYPLEHPVRSNYLLIDQDDYKTLTAEYNLKVVQLASLPIGNLYRNLDSGCKP
jgi:hypothetical protein